LGIWHRRERSVGERGDQGWTARTRTPQPHLWTTSFPARKGDSDPPVRLLPFSVYHAKTGMEQVLPSVGGITSAQGRRSPGHFFGGRPPF